jgi:NADPH2:quinone reductase
MARIVRYHETGSPDVLRVEDGDPGRPGPGEVLLAVEAIGLNRAEAAQRGGHYIVTPPLPARLGAECAGTILAVGPDVTQWRQGDLITTLPPGKPGNFGSYASETLWPATSLMARTAELDVVRSAATWVAFFTAWGGLIDAGKLVAGDFVIITAASSSVGLAAIQIAKNHGAIPIATTRKSTKNAALMAAGAAYVITTEEQDLAAEVKRITGGAGVPLIFDPIAGPFVDTLFECLSVDGVLMIYGGMSNQPAVFPRHAAIGRNLTMRGFNFFGLIASPERRAPVQAAILERVLDGRYTMPIAATFGLEDVVEAHRLLERNEHIGKIVLVP